MLQLHGCDFGYVKRFWSMKKENFDFREFLNAIKKGNRVPKAASKTECGQPAWRKIETEFVEADNHSENYLFKSWSNMFPM